MDIANEVNMFGKTGRRPAYTSRQSNAEFAMVRYLLFAAALLSDIGTGGAAVAAMETPNWWAGYAIDPVRQLVHESDLQNATVTETGELKVGPLW